MMEDELIISTPFDVSQDEVLALVKDFVGQLQVGSISILGNIYRWKTLIIEQDPRGIFVNGVIVWNSYGKETECHTQEPLMLIQVSPHVVEVRPYPSELILEEIPSYHEDDGPVGPAEVEREAYVAPLYVGADYLREKLSTLKPTPKAVETTNMVLNSSPIELVNLLTPLIGPGENIPLEEGRISLHEPRYIYVGDPPQLSRIEIDGLHQCTKDGQTVTTSLGTVVSFELSYIAPGRLRVRAECLQSDVKAYFDGMLIKTLQLLFPLRPEMPPPDSKSQVAGVTESITAQSANRMPTEKAEIVKPLTDAMQISQGRPTEPQQVTDVEYRQSETRDTIMQVLDGLCQHFRLSYSFTAEPSLYRIELAFWHQSDIKDLARKRGLEENALLEKSRRWIAPSAKTVLTLDWSQELIVVCFKSSLDPDVLEYLQNQLGVGVRNHSFLFRQVATPSEQARQDAPAIIPAQLTDATSVNLPPVEDPTDQRILQWVTDDPDLTDQEIGQRLGITRQAVNTRRKRLEAMGYKVR